MKKILFIICGLLLGNILSSQKFQDFNADFTVIEKRNDDKQNSLIMGNITYTSQNETSVFEIKFPQKEKWILIDSVLTKYTSDSLISTRVLTNVSDQFMFKDILNMRTNDFDLAEFGFEVLDMTEQKGGIYIEWSPPPLMDDFLQKVETLVEEDLLKSIIFTDVDGKKINETYYEEYDVIEGIPIPVHVISKFKGNDQVLIKVVKFKNVEIN